MVKETRRRRIMDMDYVKKQIQEAFDRARTERKKLVIKEQGDEK